MNSTALARRHQLGTPGCTSPRVIAEGESWTVADVVCTCGPADRPFEERHERYAIAIVVAGMASSAIMRTVRATGAFPSGTHRIGSSRWRPMPGFDARAASSADGCRRFVAGRGSPASTSSPRNADAHVTHAIRTIDRHPAHAWMLGSLGKSCRVPATEGTEVTARRGRR